MNFIQKIKTSAKLIVLILFCVGGAIAGTVWYGFHRISNEVPAIERISDYRPLGVTQIISVENNQTKVMAEFYKERRFLTPYDQIPQKLVQAFLSAEDSTFFEHHHRDPRCDGSIRFASGAAGREKYRRRA